MLKSQYLKNIERNYDFKFIENIERANYHKYDVSMLIDQIHYLKSIKDQLEAENKELKAKLNALINPHNKGKQHPSQAIINRFNRKRHAIFSQTMPSNAVEKIVHKFEDMFKAREDYEFSKPSEIIYDCFMNKYGFKNLAERKLVRFLKSAKVISESNSEIKRFLTAYIYS